jgi:hypothetical protein
MHASSASKARDRVQAVPPLSSQWRDKRPIQGLRHRPRCAAGLWRADAPSNTQWQTIAEGKAKDKWERPVCGRKKSPTEKITSTYAHVGSFKVMLQQQDW